MKITKAKLKQIIKEEITKLGEEEEKNTSQWNRTFEGGSPKDPNFSTLDLYQKQ